MLRDRLIFGIGLAALVFSLLLLDGYMASLIEPRTSALVRWLCNGAIATAIALVLTLLASREVLRFFFAIGQRPFPLVAYLFSGGLVVGPYVSGNLLPDSPWRHDSWGMFWLALGLGVLFWRQARYRGSQDALRNLASTIFVIFYCGGLAGFMIKLRMEVGGPTGMTLLLLSMAVVKVTDAAAYFVGMFLGRNPLIPWLSPKKTWEGMIGGVAVAVLFAVLVGQLTPGAAGATMLNGAVGNVGALLVFGLMMSLTAVAGDLFESLLKRDAAMKDSGGALPGLGGILDVLDSPLLAAPAAWFFWTRLATPG